MAIDTYSQPEISDVGIIPKFPYRWATFHVKGSGYYQDLGRFFADFENNFPYFRVQNPVLTANVRLEHAAGKIECELRYRRPRHQ